MKHLLLCFCLFFVATAVGYGQTDFYVDGERGVDDTNRNNGSENLPWKTIAFAVEQVNQVAEDKGIVSISVFPAANGYTEPTVTITRPVSINGVTEDVSDTVIVQSIGTTLFDVNNSPGLVSINNLTLQGNDNATGIAASNSNNLNIVGNTFKNFAQAIQFDNSNFSEVEVEGNTFQTSTTDIVIGPTVTNLNALRIFSNQFDYPAESQVSIDNQTNSVVNAEYNWWGAAAAGSVEAAVSGNVDYSPWLNTNNETEVESGFRGDLTSVRINQDSPSATNDENNLQTAYASAQEDATLILTGSSQPYPSLVADSLSITLASEAPTDIIAVDTLVVDLNNTSDLVALSSGSLLINDSLALLSGNLQTLDTSQVILGDSIKQVDESSGRLVGDFITTPRDIGEGTTLRILGTAVGAGDSLQNLVINRVNGDSSFVEVAESQSINAQWTISANNLVTNRPVAFNWYSESDNGTDFNGANAVIWRSNDNGETWQAVTDTTGSIVVLNNPDSRQIDATSTEVNTFPADEAGNSTLWTVSSQSQPLPVILTSFTARQEESTVHLTWSTASEINSDYFQIERSPDGTDFKTLSRQTAAGDSQQELTYRYADEGAANRFSGTLYYRLKMVDFDGSFEYSDITAVALNQRPGLRVYANRATGEIKLFSDWKETRYTVQVADMLGRVLLETPLQISEDQDYTMSLSSLSPAVYVLRCIGVLDVQTSKFKVE